MTAKVHRRILYIWDADYPWDVRVEKICKALMKNGHDVHIAARNLKRLPVYERAEGLHIHRLRTWRNEKLNYTLSFPGFFSPIWKRFLDNVIRENSVELIIVRDLPMALAGIWAGRRNGIPVVFDMAEDYISMIRSAWRHGRFKALNLFVRNPYLAKSIEGYSIRKAGHILVVIDEAREVVLRAGGSLEKLTIVRNTPSINKSRKCEIKMNEQLEHIRDRFSAVYSGGVQLSRGIQTDFDSIEDLIKEIEDFLFVIVGDGKAREELEKLMKKKGLERHVLWAGWVDHERMFDYIRMADVGLIPHFVSDHTNRTIPNKIFDYMACGLPVVSSDAIPMKRILDQERCGITFKSGDAKDLAKAILEVKRSAVDYGGNGIRAVRTRFNWKEDEKELMKVIRSFDVQG